MKSLVWQQNRHQKVKVFNRLGGLTFVQWDLTFWNLNIHHCSIVLHISIRGWLQLCFGGVKPTKDSPWLRHCVAKLQFALCNWFAKVLRLRNKSSLQDMSNYLFMSMAGPKVEQRIKVVSILLHEAKPVLGLFWLHLNTIGWNGQVQECRAKKRGVGTSFQHQIKRKATPNSSNEVSICLQ